MSKTFLQALEEILRRSDYLLASLLIVFSVYLWVLGRESGYLRSLRFAMSHRKDLD